MNSDSLVQTKPYYQPDLSRLKALSAAARPAAPGKLSELLNQQSLDLENLATLLASALAPGATEAHRLIKERGTAIRRELFGSAVVPMAPVEIANTCASDCLFCGWRISNRSMKRMRMPFELAMMQVEYLIDLGIHYIEFVSGDDIAVVRDLLPDLIRATRQSFDRRGIQGKVSFCTLALTESQYKDLRDAGADNMIVWQETYDPDVFRKNIVNGPKAFGITDDWKVDRSGDGCSFRIESQERAMRAGLEVALGSMLGLNPDVITEFLATVDHAKYLMETYGATPEHPIIIGMPVWNAITTRETDLRPGDVIDMQELFPVLAALYLLALPDKGTWVFPNCRVPLKVQVEAARVAGAFSSTEVKLGPGGYLPSILREKQASGEDINSLRDNVIRLMKESPSSLDELQRSLDQREQFVHHYHAHDIYRKAMADQGLAITHGVQINIQGKALSKTI